MGVATFPQDAGDTETLLRNADAALYVSKARGRNVVSRYAATLTPEAARGRLTRKPPRGSVGTVDPAARTAACAGVAQW